MKKLKLSLSKNTMVKLSTAADRTVIFEFLTSLKKKVDQREYEKQVELENSTNSPDYIIVNGDVIEVSSIVYFVGVIYQRI